MDRKTQFSIWMQLRTFKILRQRFFREVFKNKYCILELKNAGMIKIKKRATNSNKFAKPTATVQMNLSLG